MYMISGKDLCEYIYIDEEDRRLSCFLVPKWGRPKTYIYTPSVFRIYADIQGWITNENMCNKLNS
jgi:hypothetical protein